NAVDVRVVRPQNGSERVTEPCRPTGSGHGATGVAGSAAGVDDPAARLPAAARPAGKEVTSRLRVSAVRANAQAGKSRRESAMAKKAKASATSAAAPESVATIISRKAPGPEVVLVGGMPAGGKTTATQPLTDQGYARLN